MIWSILSNFNNVVMFYAAWLFISTAPQIYWMMTREGKEPIDWAVIATRGSLALFGALIVIYHIFELSPWLTMIGWTTLDLSMTFTTFYIRRRVEENRDIRPNIYRRTKEVTRFRRSGR